MLIGLPIHFGFIVNSELFISSSGKSFEFVGSEIESFNSVMRVGDNPVKASNESGSGQGHDDHGGSGLEPGFDGNGIVGVERHDSFSIKFLKENYLM